MFKSIEIKGKTIRIYYEDLIKDSYPVVILNTFEDEGEDVFNECIKLKCKSYILVSILNIDWDNEMTPWKSKDIMKKQNYYNGKADTYIEELEKEIIPEVKKIINEELKINIDYFSIAGYSLAGLFSVYSLYKTTIFKRATSASGSFWYPGIVDFIKSSKIKANIDKIYFSLGNKESKTRNEVLASVENNTKEIEKYFENIGIDTIYEENPGNHFQDSSIRTAKGIKWILE